MEGEGMKILRKTWCWQQLSSQEVISMLMSFSVSTPRPPHHFIVVCFPPIPPIYHALFRTYERDTFQKKPWCTSRWGHPFFFFFTLPPAVRAAWMRAISLHEESWGAVVPTGFPRTTLCFLFNSGRKWLKVTMTAILQRMNGTGFLDGN